MKTALRHFTDDVLVVEPTAQSRERLRHAFEDLDLAVVVSGSVAEAEDALRETVPRLIVIEFKLFQEWPSRPQRGVPVFVLTRHPPTAEEHKAAIGAGATLILDEGVVAESELLRHYVVDLAPCFVEMPLVSSSSRAGGASVAGTFSLAAPALRDRHGRLDAQRVAAYLDVPLKSLVDGLGGSYTAVHKTPTSDAVQEILGPVYNIVAILRSVFEGDDAKVRQWLRTPRAELRNQTPLAVMLQPNRIRAVDALVSQAWLGIPD
jgi:hypothetical protein